MNADMKMPAFVWWTGQVEDVGDPLKLGRCRVRIVGHHSSDKNSVPKNALPWAHCLQPTTSAAMAGIGSSPTGLLVGSWVVGFFQDGENLQHPVIMGSFGGLNPSSQQMIDSADNAFSHPVNQVVFPLSPLGIPRLNNAATKILEYADQPDTNKLARGENIETTIHAAKRLSLTRELPVALKEGSVWSEPPSQYRAIYPQNKVYESTSGHVFEVDDTPTGERLHKYHRAGTFEEIHPNGTQVEKIVGDNYQIIYGEDRKGVGGSSTINIDGDANISIRGSINIQTSGDKINIYFPNSSKVSLDTGTFLHNVHGQYILNVRDGIIIDGKVTDLNNPIYSTLKATFMDTPFIGRLSPNSGGSDSAEYLKALSESDQRIFSGKSTIRSNYDQIIGSGNQDSEELDPDLFDAPEMVNQSLERQAAQRDDTILSQLGGGAANVIGGISQELVDNISLGIVGGGEQLFNTGIAALSQTQAFQAFQAGVIQAQQSIALAQNIADNLKGAAGQVCSILDIFSSLDGVSFGSPAEFFEKLANAVQPLADIPEAVGDAFEKLVEGAVEAVEKFATGIVQAFTGVIDQLVDTVSGLFTDPCGGGGSGLVAPPGSGTLGVDQAAPGAVSGNLDSTIDSFKRASIEDTASTTSLVDAAAQTTSVTVLDAPVAQGQGGTKVSGLPVLTLPTIGAVAAFAGLGVGLAALLSQDGGGGGGRGVQGSTGPTGPTGPDEEWNILEPTKATNLEGIPQGTTFAFGFSPLEILKELLYPSLLKFNSFDIGINENGERVPYHVGDKTLSGDYSSSWTIQDVESSIEDTVKIIEGERTLVENLNNSFTQYTINHPEYTRNSEGSIDFVISVLNEKQQEVTKTDSIFWRYPLYAGKTAGSAITSEDLETLSITTNQVGGKNPFINYTIQQMKNGITMILPQTNEPEYFYWLSPKSINDETIDSPSYGVNTSFTDVSNPNVTTIIPMTKLNDISLSKHDLSIKFNVHRSSVPFIASRTVKISE